MMTARRKTLRIITKNGNSVFTYSPMSTYYAILVLYLIALCVLYYHNKGEDTRFHFVEMSEREGSFSLVV